MSISSINPSQDLFKVSQSDLNIWNMTISGIASNTQNVHVFNILETFMVADQITYENSTVEFINAIFSVINWNRTYLKNITSTNEVIAMRAVFESGQNSKGDNLTSEIKNSEFKSLKVSVSGAILLSG
jgi:hypothetical protein